MGKFEAGVVAGEGREGNHRHGPHGAAQASSPFPGHEHGAGRDEGNAEPIGNGKPRAEEQDPEKDPD